MTAFELTKLILIIIAVLIVTFGLIGGGAYVFLRIFANMANARRDTWEAAGAELGLKVDRNKGAITKPLHGTVDGHKIEVTSVGAPAGDTYADYPNQIICQAFFPEPISFQFSIRSRTRLLQELASVFVGYDMEMGVDYFDNAFDIQSPSPDNMRKMLAFEPKNGMEASIMTDLFVTLKRGISIEVNDVSVKFAVEANVENTEAIRGTVKDAITLATRIRAAHDAIQNPPMTGEA